MNAPASTPATPPAEPSGPDAEASDARLIALWLHGRSFTTRVYRRDVARFRAFVGGKALREVTLADLQAFPPGSTLYAPVPMPASLRDASNLYAGLVAKNVESLITGSHAPLYVRPTGSALSEEEKTDQTEQQPKLDGLTPGLPGRPFCFKAKPSIVGLYQGGGSYASDIFHPTGQFCMMRNDHQDYSPFCAVCRYIMVELIDPFQHSGIDLDYDDIYPLR